MNFEQARFNMVEQQVRPWDVLDPDVLDLFMTIRREEFVPQAYRNLAFADIEVPLACGQTMLKPVIEGRMLQALKVRQGESALLVGAGSGYLAALLAATCVQVQAVEIEPELVRFASANLERYGCGNASVIEADGLMGLPAAAPFDVIVLAGGVQAVPSALLEQVKPGGRLFAFVGEAPVQKARLMTCVAPGEFAVEDVFETLLPMLKASNGSDIFDF